MHLAHKEQSAISDAIHQADADAMTYLFGLRANDTAKGGNIDQLVLSKRINLMTKLEILAQLHSHSEAECKQDRYCHISRYHPAFLRNDHANRSAIMKPEKIGLLQEDLTDN